MADEKRDEKVKVIDRRWITVDGESKEPSVPERVPQPAPAAPPNPAPPPPPTEPSATGPTAGETTDDGLGPTSQVGFLDLVDFLAQQAAALLSGQIPGRGRDPATARFFIDLLAVVKEKTAGQLAREEASYLEDVLYQLRSLFLAATR